MAPTEPAVGALALELAAPEAFLPGPGGLRLGFLHMKDADLLARIAADTKTAGAIEGQDMQTCGEPGRNRPSGPLPKVVPNPQLGLSLFY